jgi:uncharacterized protein (UPF0332 family)
MNPKEFQYLASGLAEHGTSPSEFRTAISRAYYAAFNLGFNLLNELGLTIANNHEAHKQVYYHFNNSGDSDLIEVATKIDDLRTKRNHADYHLDRPDVEKQHNAKMYVYSADRLIKTMEKQCKGKNRSQIIKAMKDWRKKTSPKHII